MLSKAPMFDLIGIFSSLTQIPLQHRDKSEALKKIVELGKIAMGSQVCTLTYLDPKTGLLTQAACVGFEEGSEESKVHRIVGSIENRGAVNFNRVTAGTTVEAYDLQIDGKGIVKVGIASKYNLNSALCYPLVSEDQLIGYLNHFSPSRDKFTDEKKQLFEVFARQAVITIEKFEHRQTSDRSLSILTSLSESLLTVSEDDFLRQIVEKSRELLSVPICIVWKIDETQQKLKIAAANDEVDTEYRQFELDLNTHGIKHHLLTHRVACLPDVRKQPSKYIYSAEAASRGWVSLLSGGCKLDCVNGH